MTKLTSISLVAILSSCGSSASQNPVEASPRLVGGPCEGCEAIFEYGEMSLAPVDTLPGFDEQGPKLKIYGTVFQKDGKTPAEGVVLYVYHTDGNGIYATRGGETGWAKRHGYLRGWVKTGKDGKYTFYTLKPGPYPESNTPAHIHPTILEPDGKYYWIESYHFEGDPLLRENEISPVNPRGGRTGLVSLKREGDLWVGTRDIVLGQNVPGYE